jgi:hypothetical protein
VGSWTTAQPGPLSTHWWASADPGVGCPANGSSPPGVKIRSRALHLLVGQVRADSGQRLGNCPQAFTHLALIDAVMLLIEAETTQAARA